MKPTKSLFLSLIFALALLLQPVQSVAADTIPVTGPNLENIQPASATVNSLSSFTASVAVSGNPNLVAGIFARGQFAMAAQYGTVALLAHNYLLGQQFFSVAQGKVLSLVYGDGHANTYRVKQVLRYQALSPNSPYSDFVDLDDPSGARISVTDLFYKVYTQNGQLVLQTCIESDGNSSWGRLFVIAEPAHLVTSLQPNRYVANLTMVTR